MKKGSSSISVKEPHEAALVSALAQATRSTRTSTSSAEEGRPSEMEILSSRLLAGSRQMGLASSGGHGSRHAVGEWHLE